MNNGYDKITQKLLTKCIELQKKNFHKFIAKNVCLMKNKFSFDSLRVFLSYIFILFHLMAMMVQIESDFFLFLLFISLWILFSHKLSEAGLFEEQKEKNPI